MTNGKAANARQVTLNMNIILFIKLLRKVLTFKHMFKISILNINK